MTDKIIDKTNNSSNSLPVTSILKIEEVADNSELIMNLQWGGYYYQKGNNSYSVVRLLDMDSETCHWQIYDNIFNEIPKLSDLKDIEPSALHIPVPKKYIFQAGFHYIGSAPLYMDDLRGFRAYLEMNDWELDVIDSYLKTIIGYSHKKPLTVRFTYRQGLISGEEYTANSTNKQS